MASTVWKGYVTFGLVSIPVRLFKAARAERVTFHQLRKAQPESAPAVAAPEPARRGQPGGPKGPVAVPDRAQDPMPEKYERVHQQLVAPAADHPGEQAPVARSEIVKGYEYEKNQYVVIPDEELKNAVPETSTQMEIVEFVKLDEIDPIYFETSYYMQPEEAGRKAYALLFEAMQATHFVALAEVAMHRREHVMVIRPGKRGLITHTMYYAQEVRSAEEYRVAGEEVSGRELTLAKQLIESLVAPFDAAKYKDKSREKIQALIDARLAGKEVEQVVTERKPAEVVDIMAALQNSLKALKKPAASTPAKPAAAKKRRASG